MAVAASRIHTFAEGLDHPECVAVHPDGSVWAGGEGGQIYRMPPEGGKVEEVARVPGGFVLGIAFDPGGRRLLACDLRNRCIWRIDLSARRPEVFARGADGHAFSIPNHLVFARDGSVYASDSGAFGKKAGKILKFDGDGRGVVWHEGPFAFANGLALSSDERTLYAVSSFLPGVERIAVKSDGTAGRRSIFARLPGTVPDGAALDAKGNLYVCCYAPSRIQRIAPDGTVSVAVEDWTAHALGSPTNIAFGGPKFDQLFAANLSRWHVARIDLRVKGMPLAVHAVSGR